MGFGMDRMGIGEVVAQTHLQFKVRMGGETRKQKGNPRSKTIIHSSKIPSNGDGDLFSEKKQTSWFR